MSLSEMSQSDDNDVTTPLTHGNTSETTWQRYNCELREDLIQKAKDELNEKPEWRERDIQALRDMISCHPGTY